MKELNRIYNEDCIQGLKDIDSESVDVVLTDPPYLYLKGQKLDREFDEEALFDELKRVLKKDGFVVMFGRGESFYRWNTMLADRGFTFKEEIIWNKSYCTSPLMPISRVHETVSIFTKGNGTINKVKVPYLEMKWNDIDGVIQDVKRMRSILKNPKSLNAVLKFLEMNYRNDTAYRDKSDGFKSKSQVTYDKITKENRCVSVIRSMEKGMNEKSIIRTDREDCPTFTKHGVNCDKRKTGNRCVNVMQSMEFGMNEKTIIKQVRDHYNAIHPTQKPVRLLERLLALVSKEGDTVLDPFIGSGSTAIAAKHMNCNYIGFEIDKEYYTNAVERVKSELL